MGALALSLLALFACASSQCLGAGETSAFTLSATRFMGTVQSVTYVTPERLVLQTDDPDRSIYFSLDGGLTWFEPQLEQDAAVRALTSVVMCFADSPVCYILRGNGNLWSSADQGRQWSARSLGATLPLYSIRAHPAARGRLIGQARSASCAVPSQATLSCHGYLTYSGDGGQSWLTLKTYVWEAEWAAQSPQRILYSYFRSQTGNMFNKNPLDLTFALSDDLLSSERALFQQAVDFLTVKDGRNSETLWVGVARVPTQSVQLYASTNQGNTFTLINFPSRNALPQGYDLLDATLGTAFVHVRYRDADAVGDLFASDLTDGAFQPSLANQSSSFSLGVPWVEVFSVPGSYLTARARNGAVTSVLTRDMGQTWSPLAPATEVCEDNPGCQVHLFFAPDTRLGAVQSVPAALGVIMGVGHEGYTLNVLSENPNTYVTVSGGQLWEQTLVGAHVHAIVDSGAVLAAVDLRPATVTSLLFSLDVGASWRPCQLSAEAFRVTGLFSHPGGADTRMLVVGALNGTASLGVAVDTRAVYTRDCVGRDSATGDYELWAANWEACVQGRRVTYVRRRRSAQCRVPPAALQNNTFAVQPCECARADFTCAACFRLTAAGECEPDTPACANPQPPPTPCIGFYSAPSGYRKRAGNACVGGVQAALLAPVMRACPLTAGAIAAIALTVAFVVIVAVVIVVFVLMHRRRRAAAAATAVSSAEPAGVELADVGSLPPTSAAPEGDVIAEDFL